MKTTVTLFRYYYKTVKIEIDSDATEGLTPEEIATKLMEEDIVFNDEQVHDTPLIGMDCTGNNEEDRFDVHDENGNHVYGGHL